MRYTQLHWLLVVVIVLVRVAYYYAQPDLNTDHILHMAMAQNFMNGNGFSLKYLNPNNEIYYTTTIASPPLYPFFLGITNYITSNTLLSSFLIQIIVIFFFVFIWKKILNLFSELISEFAFFYFIALLIISTSILNNINTILVFALMLLSVSLYYIFAYLFKERSKLNLTLSALFAALLFWTHYSYFLVAFYPAVIMLILFALKKNRGYLLAGIGSFIISLIITSGLIVYNFLTTGNINYMSNTNAWNAGFFPEHLLLADPIFLNAFFKTAYFEYISKKQYFSITTLAFHFMSLTILSFIIFFYVKLRKKKIPPFEKITQLFIPFFVIIVLILFFLLYFTLHYHEIPRPGWTHIGETRYMGAVYMSIIAIVVMLLFTKVEYVSKEVIKVMRLLMMVLIFISLTINIYITADHWGKFSFNLVDEVPTDNLTEFYNNIKFELSKENIPVFINNDLTVRSVRMSQFAGAAVIHIKDIEKFKDFPSNMVFFFILPEKEYYRDEDHRLLQWGRNYQLKATGKVYSVFDLYRVNK